MKELLATYGIAIGVIGSICAVIGALLWPYTINEWLIFFDKEPVVLWWHGAILGFTPVIGQATIPAAVVTWILMLILI
jgi:ABC-type lipoprotein release transport system permease subunit